MWEIEMRFNGDVYDPAFDDERLSKQQDRIKLLMLDGLWRTLPEIEMITGDPPASISAQLRHLRKPRFGSFCVEKRSRGDRVSGLFEYRLLPATDQEKKEVLQTRNMLMSAIVAQLKEMCDFLEEGEYSNWVKVSRDLIQQSNKFKTSKVKRQRIGDEKCCV